MMSQKSDKNTPRAAFFIVAAILLLTCIPRFIDIHFELPYYSIDENDVVEMAVSTMGGDMDYRFYKYGPLTGYILSATYYGVYLGERIFSRISFDSFVQRIFFENRTQFYFIARLLNVFFNLLFIIFVFHYCVRFFDPWTTWLAVGLASLPLGELLSGFYIRVDTLQALCAFAAFYFVMVYYDINRPRLKMRNIETKKTNKGFKNLVLAGLCAGFSIAAKPIPGLVIVPVILLILVFSHRKVLPSRLFILIAFIFIGNFIGNPYSVFNISKFISYNLASIAGETKRTFLAGYDITRFLGTWGWPLTLAGFTGFIIGILQRKDKILRLTCIFPILYFFTFALVPARDYFYIALVPYLSIVIARIVVLGTEKYLKRNHLIQGITIIIIFCILAIFPVYNTIAKSIYYRSYDAYCCTAAEEWVKKNIPQGSNLLFYGFYTNLPFLIEADISRHANLAEYFMYHREENEWWINQYLKAYNQKVQSGCSTYHISKIRKNYQHDQELPGFLNYCKKKSIQYVLLNSDEHQQWEKQARLVSAFHEGNGFRGGNIRIYKII